MSYSGNLVDSKNLVTPFSTYNAMQQKSSPLLSGYLDASKSSVKPKVTVPTNYLGSTQTTQSTSSKGLVSLPKKDTNTGPLVQTNQQSFSPGQLTTDPKTGLTIGNAGPGTTSQKDAQGNTINADGSITYLNPTDQNAQNASSALSAFQANGGVNPNGPQTKATTYPGIVSSAVNAANQNPAIAQNAADIASRYGQQIADVGQRGAMAQAGYKTTGTTPVGEGNAAVIGQTTAAQQQALASGEQAALAGTAQQLTAQQQQQSGLLGAAGLVPEALRYGGTEPGSIMGDSIQHAIQMIQNGATTQDAMASIIGGDVGKNAFIAKMQQFDPKWNPTASNAIAVQNMTQGALYQGKATELNTNLTQMKTVTAPILDLLTKADINQQDVPAFNGSINEYSKQFLNPSNQASLKGGIAELKTYISNILGAGGDLTPTAITEMTQSFDPGNFTRQQLSDFLKNLDNYGQARLQGFQQSSQGSYGGQGFTGAQATPSTNATISPNNPSTGALLGGTTNPVVQGLVGGAMGALGGIEGMISGVASILN